MELPSLSPLAHPRGPKQAAADSGWGLLVVSLLTDSCLSRVPKSERTMVHKNLTFSLASAEGFLMASEWAKANKVGTQQCACELRGDQTFLGCLPHWLPSLGSISWGEHGPEMNKGPEGWRWAQGTAQRPSPLIPPWVGDAGREHGTQSRATPTAGLAGARPPSCPQVACMAVTAVMHLLFLVAFSWMLVEGLLLWSKVVVVSMRPGPRMTLYYATGWGEPLCSPLLLCSQPCLVQPLAAQHRPMLISTRHPAPASDTSSAGSALSPSS